MGFIDVLFGRPLASTEDEGERITPTQGIPTFGLDALSSAAYGPEAALTILLPLGLVGVRHNVPDPHQPQRQQNRQSRLRPVSRRTQSIQTERRNPLRRSNPLPLVFGRSEWPPKQNINEPHSPSHPATITKPETSAKPSCRLSNSSHQTLPTVK